MVLQFILRAIYHNYARKQAAIRNTEFGRKLRENFAKGVTYYTHYYIALVSRRKHARIKLVHP